MTNTAVKLTQLIKLLEKYAPHDGAHQTAVSQVGTFRVSAPQPRTPLIYDARIIILAQGEKICYIGNKQYQFTAGQCLVITLPVPVEVEIMGATADKPALMTGIIIDLNKIARLLLKLENSSDFTTPKEIADPSSVSVQTLNDEMLDAVIRLFQTMGKPSDRDVLSESIIEEIYYRLLAHNQVGALQMLLAQRRQIQQISKVVVHIHSRLDQVVLVEELASLVGMSSSGFHKTFKEIMHMSPLQYAKSIKLTHSQSLLREGRTVAEASRLVGYNSTTQFSREFKRHFGYPPSQT